MNEQIDENEVMIIVDLEATCCDERRIPRDEMEIIEIGAVAVKSASGEVLGEYQTFIRPVRHRQLTTFCMALTGIQQEDVDAARTFPEVLPQFAAWLKTQRPWVWGSWGDYDRNQFAGDCRFHNLENPLPKRHRNIKQEFATAMGQKKMGVGQALEYLGLEFEGRAHRALDDTQNIARLYRRIVSKPA